MKKIKSLFCVALLSTCLAGNVFAGGIAMTTGTGFFSIFSEAFSAVVSLLRGSNDDCPPRQCTMCKPGGNENDPNCRPR